MDALDKKLTDRLFCSSPNCQNKCGRKMTPEMERHYDRYGTPVTYQRFCDETKEAHEHE